MENQHREISGYRELDQSTIDLINQIKANGNDLGVAIEVIEKNPDVDKRAVAIAKTNLQTGLMWLIRAIAKPQGF